MTTQLGKKEVFTNAVHTNSTACISFCAIMIGICFSGFAFCSESTNELIIRYRSPSDSRAAAADLTSGAASSTDLLNESEGVVRARFKSSLDADAILKNLQNSDSVLSVSKNMLYRPAISLREHTPASETAVATAAPFKSMFDLTELLGQAPDVSLPGPFTPGADPFEPNDWALKAIHMPALADLSAALGNAAPVIAAVIDTGVDYNHEDLVGAMWRNPENPQQVGFDFAHNSDKPYDVLKFDVEGCLADKNCSTGADTSKFLVNPGHGTHCAGHVGAVAGNSTGIRGVGTRVQVMGLKFFYDAGEVNAGQGDDASAIRSIDFAIQHGVKVISASWGGRSTRTEGEQSELKQAIIRAQQAGVLMIIAAGNDGINQDTDKKPGYPAAYDLDNLIVVAATDANDNLADFSSYGQKSVHIAAPGVKILSTTVGSQYNDVVASYHDHQGKVHSMDWDGTSMATPIVAGAASLLWALHPQADYHQIRDMILRSARPVPALAGNVATGGVLNVAGALGLE